jgi:hypothetical protein
VDTASVGMIPDSKVLRDALPAGCPMPSHTAPAAPDRQHVSVSTRRKVFQFQYRDKEVPGGNFSFRGVGMFIISLLRAAKHLVRPIY